MRGSGWLPRTSTLLRYLVAVAAVVLAYRDLPWWRWVSALQCSLGLCTQAGSRVECPLPRALGAHSDFPLLIIDIFSYFMKSSIYLMNFFSSQNLNGILWVSNADWTIHKVCCFKVSILNIWFWTQSMQSSTSCVWLCLVRCFSMNVTSSLSFYLQFILGQPSLVWLKTVEDLKALDCHFLNLGFKVFKYFKSWFF